MWVREKNKSVHRTTNDHRPTIDIEHKIQNPPLINLPTIILPQVFYLLVPNDQMIRSFHYSIGLLMIRFHIAHAFTVSSRHTSTRAALNLQNSIVTARAIGDSSSSFTRRSRHTGTTLVKAIDFHQEVSSWLETSQIPFQDITIQQSPYKILGLGLGQDEEGFFAVGLHIIPTPTNLSSCMQPNLFKKLTDDATLPFKTLIHLHQDVWKNKKEIVQARISAKVNRVNHRWYARKTIPKRIDITTTIDFLETHHLWGATRSKFNYGLFSNDELVAVGTFSPRRHVQRGVSSRPYRSHELIRYCAKRDGHVIGGITKLVSSSQFNA